ncbi:uncharacterized protein JCM15063_002925 [Sporobolomyces koalae]|uniref:uncharacterized protein n=1 Tax=Sporobolomyces koalae TaxID=500713 RepID=UPI00317ADEAA
MSESASVASLKSVLRSPAPGAAAPTLPSSTTANSASSASRTDSYARTYTSPTSWGSTLSSAFGFRAVSSRTQSASEFGTKPKARARIPLWEQDDENKGPDVKESDATHTSESARSAADEAERALVDSILFEVVPESEQNNSKVSNDRLLVLASSRVPEPCQALATERLLAGLVSKFETVAATGSYSIVLLANPTPHPPSTSQLVSAYLSLSRTTRKNLSKIWVVGGGWWTRVILTLFSATLLSVKVAKKQKIVHCAGLTQLAEAIGTETFTLIEFPLEVYLEDTKVEPEIRLPDAIAPVFGEPLDKLFEPDGDLPPVLRDCLEVLSVQGPSSLGIFRRSPSAATVKILESAYHRRHRVTLATVPDAPYLAASLLKLFLRSLPHPILPPSIWKLARDCPSSSNQPHDPWSRRQESIEFIQTRILPLLPPCDQRVLKEVLQVAHEIAKASQVNLMSSSNLVICLAPALIGGGGGMVGIEQIEACQIPRVTGTNESDPTLVRETPNSLGGVLKIMIESYDEIFETNLNAPIDRPEQTSQPENDMAGTG